MPALTQHKDSKQGKKLDAAAAVNLRPHCSSFAMNLAEKVKGRTLCGIHVMTVFRVLVKSPKHWKETFTSCTSSMSIRVT